VRPTQVRDLPARFAFFDDRSPQIAPPPGAPREGSRYRPKLVVLFRPPYSRAPVAPRRRPRFPRGRHLVRRCTCHLRIHAGTAGRMGHAAPYLLRRPWRQPARAFLMSPRRRSPTRHWQGEVLRGHTHSDGIVLAAVLGLAFYTDRFDDSLWFGSMRLGPTPARADLCPEPKRDGRRDASHPKP
jgi:hypothetical protein